MSTYKLSASTTTSCALGWNKHMEQTDDWPFVESNKTVSFLFVFENKMNDLIVRTIKTSHYLRLYLKLCFYFLQWQQKRIKKTLFGSQPEEAAEGAKQIVTLLWARKQKFKVPQMTLLKLCFNSKVFDRKNHQPRASPEHPLSCTTPSLLSFPDWRDRQNDYFSFIKVPPK